MKKILLFIFAVMFAPVAAMASLAGFYQTIDDHTNQPKSVVLLYEYADGDDTHLAGRIVALYGGDGKIAETVAAPVKVAANVRGAPKFSGLDIIWDMEWDADDRRYEDGKIMDPTSGRVYSSVIWQDAPGVLNVRGKIGPVGRTQRWHRIDASQLPQELQKLNASAWTPNIRK